MNNRIVNYVTEITGDYLYPHHLEKDSIEAATILLIESHYRLHLDSVKRTKWVQNSSWWRRLLLKWSGYPR